MLRIVYLLICFTLLLGFSPNIESAHAVPKAVKAKSEFMLADKLFNEKKYSGAIKHAEKAKSILGKTNSRIEYLLTKSYYKINQYDKALQAIEAFFKVTPESEAGSKAYSEMVVLYAPIEEKEKEALAIKKQKEKEVLALKKRKEKEALALKKRKEKEALALKKRKEKEALAFKKTLSELMATVPSGCFQMGSTSENDDEKPIHNVCVDGFAIGKYEVTQALWSTVMGSNPSNFQGQANPVEQVSWNDVQQFLRKLNSKTGGNYRLPTEAEWEFAARSGGKNEKYSGGSNPDRVAWYGSNSGNTTHPVGQKTANGLGLYDMSGNVWEWCQDWYGKNYYGNSPSNNPAGPSSGGNRVARGGSWGSGARGLRSADRDCYSPGNRYGDLGLRLVLP